MARLDEIAEGIAAVLAASPTPEPLFLDMMNHTPVEVTFLIRAAVDACERHASPLSRVRVGATIGSDMVRTLGLEPRAHEGVAIDIDDELDRRIEFYRFPKDSSK